ncbi:MAG TPA: hypothetical protein VKX96_08035 [Chloroflexota bacterium]|nr:hypothetical protein [Chloroflexota bacterium]
MDKDAGEAGGKRIDREGVGWEARSPVVGVQDSRSIFWGRIAPQNGRGAQI